MLLTTDEARKKGCWQWTSDLEQPYCTADSCMAWETVGDKGYCRMVRCNASSVDPGFFVSPPFVVRKPEDLE